VAASRWNLEDDEYLILRGREALSNGRNYTNPYLEQTKLGAYNEIVVAASKDEVLATGLVGGKVHTVFSDFAYSGDGLTDLLRGLSSDSSGDAAPTFTFRLVAKVADFDKSNAFWSNRLHLPESDAPATVRQRLAGAFNNSHTYAQSVLRALTGK
jgi:hypothetical protein